MKREIGKINPDFDFRNKELIKQLKNTNDKLKQDLEKGEEYLKKTQDYWGKGNENLVYFVISSLIITVLSMTNTIDFNIPNEYLSTVYLLTGLNISVTLCVKYVLEKVVYY